MRLAVFRCRTHVVSDTDTYYFTELCEFLKFLAVSPSPCRVLCRYPCFIITKQYFVLFYWIWYLNGLNQSYFLLKKCVAGEICWEWKRAGSGTEERTKSNGQNIGCEWSTYILLYLGSTRYINFNFNLMILGSLINIIWSMFNIIYEGDGKSEDQLPMACKDSVAILIMFDLTSRCTLNR